MIFFFIFEKWEGALGVHIPRPLCIFLSGTRITSNLTCNFYSKRSKGERVKGNDSLEISYTFYNECVFNHKNSFFSDILCRTCSGEVIQLKKLQILYTKYHCKVCTFLLWTNIKHSVITQTYMSICWKNVLLSCPRFLSTFVWRTEIQLFACGPVFWCRDQSQRASYINHMDLILVVGARTIVQAFDSNCF